MSGRHSRPVERNGVALRKVAGAGAGVAGIASLLAGAPLLIGAASADTAPTDSVTTETAVTSAPVTTVPDPGTSTAVTPVPTDTDGQPLPTETTTAPTTAPVPDPGTTTVVPVLPDYGKQKFRVGVERDPSSEIPTGITTSGSTAHVVERAADGSVVDEFDCTTSGSGDPTYCPGTDLGLYEAQQPGDTIEVTQTGHAAGLQNDPTTQKLGPCTDVGFRRAAQDDDEQVGCFGLGVVLDDAGLLPTATNDSATTPMDTPVTVGVLGNDFSYGTDDTYSVAIADTTIAGEPHDGTAKVNGSPATQAPTATRRAAAVGPFTITYTPNAGFHGVDTFTYTIKTHNGTSTAAVEITVPGPASDTTAPNGVDPTSSSRGVDPTSATRSPDSTTSSALSDTGTPVGQLAGYGAGLVAAGAGVAAAGRHRRRHRRAH